MNGILYNILSQTIRTSKEVLVLENCNSWTAVNQGSDIVVVEGIRLLPPVVPNTTGDSVAVEGNIGEVYNKATIKVVFQSTTAPQLLIVQKVYAEENHAQRR